MCYLDFSSRAGDTVYFFWYVAERGKVKSPGSGFESKLYISCCDNIE
jgi:hypothetical protein